ncbi:MAG TPA: glycosyltransferase family 1 protein [Solirubrobacteraceae bacterium]|nr:glycosyltransferase family 1 protein [Solirubrobacteraceae bacterium]
MALRVAFDTTPLLLNRAGEARYARRLLAALRARDDVAVHALSPGRRVPRSLGQRVLLQGTVQAVYYPIAQPRRIRTLAPDLVHLPRHLVPPQSASRAPQVVTIHDVLPLRAPALFPAVVRANFRLLTPRLARRAARVVTGSHYTRGEIAELLDVPLERIVVTPYGVDAGFRPAPLEPALLRARFGIDRPYVACVGTLEPRKNLAAAVRAFARLADDGGALVLVGGRGWDGGEVATLARRARGRVVLTGHVSDEELVGLLSGARCFVYPSLFEGFGLPPLEAMACGTPVVTSARASLPEVVGDAALVVEPEDEEALAAALRRVLHEPGLAARLTEAGLRRARAYTWSRCAEQTVSVYREVAG